MVISNYGKWLQTNIHTHLCNAVPLVWGLLRLTPIKWTWHLHTSYIVRKGDVHCTPQQLLPHVHMQGVSVCRCCCLSVYLSAQKYTRSQDSAISLVLNTFELCETLKTALSVLLFAGYTLQASYILSLHPWTRL